MSRPTKENSSPDPDVARLLDLALAARDAAYCPYSKFPVGSAIRCGDGSEYSGCNVENASYSLTICAERSAIVTAVTAGRRDVTHVAVAGDVGEEYLSPCGACRQVLAEFGPDMTVYLVRPDRQYVTLSMADLLPQGFRPDQLRAATGLAEPQ